MHAHAVVAALALAVGAMAAAPVAAWDPTGSRVVKLHARDGTVQTIGSVSFGPLSGGRHRFELKLDGSGFTDHFLSMREFKCLDGQGEILCHEPYPHARPDTVAADDLAWLEHALLFMFKLPREFGARLWNGIYFQLRVTEQGLAGTPQAIDLNLIGAPPARTDVPPYPPARRDDIAPDARWFVRLTIE
jgi:hypothetical protein